MGAMSVPLSTAEGPCPRAQWPVSAAARRCPHPGQRQAPQAPRGPPLPSPSCQRRLESCRKHGELPPWVEGHVPDVGLGGELYPVCVLRRASSVSVTTPVNLELTVDELNTWVSSPESYFLILQHLSLIENVFGKKDNYLYFIKI